MPLKSLRIFVSSPGDVAEERLIARRVIGRLEAQFGDALKLEPLFWEHEPLLATASFQEQVPRPSDADIAIVILWSRIGTVLPGHIRRPDGSLYNSGTEFEFEDAVEGFRRNGKPELLVYRKTARPNWPADDALTAQRVAQKVALDGFIDKWFVDRASGAFTGAFHSFESPADFEELLEAHLTRIIERALGTFDLTRPASRAWHKGSPFRGLETFDPEHASIFFGRTAAIATVLMKLRKQAERGTAFVLIMGMSGGGKSSLARAGVLPLMLHPGVLGRAPEWRYARFRPSDGHGDLASALVAALAQTSAIPELPGSGTPAHDAFRASLLEAPLTFAEQVDAALGGTCHLALVVDQLEEIFTDDRIDQRQRERFAAALDALSRTGSVWIVATMRSDLYPRLSDLPVFMALKEGDGQFDLLPPTMREIGQIIRLPAAAAGLRFESRPHTAERLDDTIRDAAAGNAAALPLLEFLLEELYKRRSTDNVLTFRAYEELGGVAGALAQRAEEVLEAVSPEARATLPLILRELVSLNVEDDTTPMRAVAPLSAFTAGPARELLQALLEARLFVSNLDDRGQPVISVAHEALLEHWPRVQAWADENREHLRAHARLSAAVRTWEREGRSRDFLLQRGKPLVEARTLIAEGVRLSDPEKALVEASDRRAKRFGQLRAAAIVGLVVLALSASAAAWFATRESERARIQARTSQRTSDFLVSLFSSPDPSESRGTDITVSEFLDRSVDAIENSLSDEPAVRGNLMRAMGQAYNGLGEYPKARTLLQEAVDNAASGGGGEGLIKARVALGFNYYMDGEYEPASVEYRQALSEAETLYGNRHDLVAASLRGLADSIFELDQAAEAERLYRRALAIERELHGERHADTARTLHDLGILLYYQGRYDEAERLYRQSLATYRGLYGENHPAVAQNLNDLAGLLYDTGRFESAIQIYKEAVPIYHKVYGPQHPEYASGIYNLGRVLLITGNLDSAEDYLRRTLAIDRQRLAVGHEDLILPLNSLAMLDIARGNLTEADLLLKEALASARDHKHWMLGQILINAGDLDVRLGRIDPAGAALDEARNLLEAEYGTALSGEAAWRLAILNSVTGSYEIERGQLAEAERRLVVAWPVLRARFGPRSYYGDQCLAHLGRLYDVRGNAKAAREYRALLSSRPGAG
ncbi:MAG TPA: tetratricopeptide repeat protein [Vicinamibacterales bacterium]|nr:tetratricopeptide repeat protein [Vicinamibacterales bacterium]